MKRSTHLLSFFFLLTFASIFSAQTPVTCGVTEIEMTAQADPGQPLVFKAVATGVTHTTKPQFNWYVSLGTIVSGQGTNEMTLDVAGLGGQVVTVTVELAGAPRNCKATESITTNIKPAGVGGHPFDSYGDISSDDEEARLDNFAIQLQNDPQSSGYIFMTAGRETFEGEARYRLNRIKSYLLNVRKVDSTRIVTFDCGFSTDLTIQLFIIPVGAMPLTCNNPAEVPVSEVKFTKPRPQSKKKP